MNAGVAGRGEGFERYRGREGGVREQFRWEGERICGWSATENCESVLNENKIWYERISCCGVSWPDDRERRVHARK